MGSTHRGVLIAQFTDAVVVLQHPLELQFDQRAHVGGQLLVECVAIVLLRDVFTALALGENRVVVPARQGRFDVDPAPMQRASDRPAVLGLASEFGNACL